VTNDACCRVTSNLHLKESFIVTRKNTLICGPVNKAGVIYLFSAMTERLGFVVMCIHSGLPDCEAMRLVKKERWKQTRIDLNTRAAIFCDICTTRMSAT